jgi:predicted ATPase
MSFDIQDPLVTLLYFFSQDLLCLGYLDQARFRSDAALEEASKLDRAYSLAIALFGACRVDWATGSHEELVARANALIAVAEEHGFPWQRAVGTIYRGWALAGSGQTTEEIVLLEAGVAAYRASGAVNWVPFFLMLLADAEGMAKQRDQGLGHLAEAERVMAETEERWAEAELYRVRGELLRAGHDTVAAQRSFFPSYRYCAKAECEVLGAARGDQSRPTLARAGQARCGPRSPRTDLRLVHRGL